MGAEEFSLPRRHRSPEPFGTVDSRDSIRFRGGNPGTDPRRRGSVYLSENFRQPRRATAGPGRGPRVLQPPRHCEHDLSEDGLTLAGQAPRDVAESLQGAGADVVAANCGFRSPADVGGAERMRFETGPPLGAMPNAGLPTRIDGRARLRVGA